MPHYKLLIESARQLVQVTDAGARVLCGTQMQNLAVIEGKHGQGISLVVNSCDDYTGIILTKAYVNDVWRGMCCLESNMCDGLIADFGEDDVIKAKYGNATFDQTIDATNRCVIPGFVDAHTHPVWAGDRVHEFAMKLAGATYMEVHKAGGGIHFTVEHTRAANEEILFDLFTHRLKTMIHCGTTLVECKSGYGLDVDTEVKMLKVIERGKQELNIDISSTYCGAHAVPKNKSPVEAAKDVLEVQIPRITELMVAGTLHVDNIDVFCENGVFDVKQSRDILMAGKRAGLAINFHGDELHPMHSAEMGAEIGALAISHLEEISEEGIAAMSKARTVAVVLPTTAYILRLKPPPVRRMIEAGVPVALGSDFNPNAYCMSMPLVMHLACVTLRMSMPEVLVAATLNAAAALGKADTHGSVEKGKVANLLVVDAPSWEHIIYQMGCHEQLIQHVIWHGNIAHSKVG